MAGTLERLAGALSPSQAAKLASSLEIDGSLLKASATLPYPADLARVLFAESYDDLGPTTLARVLRGFAASARANATDLRPVWSGPSFPGDGDHTTAALAHLIDEATEEVFASTYSASPDSLYLKALWRAVARQVKTTLLLDTTINDGKTAAWLQKKLTGARFLGFKPGPHGGIQHSKVVVVDSRIAFITSANLSEAAHERNLEAGVIVREPGFASALRQRFAALQASGHLYPLSQTAQLDG